MNDLYFFLPKSMTDITTDTSINQTYVNNNTGPFRVSSGATVTFTSDLTMDLSNNKYFEFTGNGTIDGRAYKVTLTDASGAFIRGTNSSTHNVFNIGVVSGTGHSVGVNSGGVYDPQVSNMTVTIKNCYYIGDLTSARTGGVYGSNLDASNNFLSNTSYIQDCYHIGDINDISGSDSGGIVGYAFGNAQLGLIFNCYQIGTVSVFDGAITGNSLASNNGSVYLYNCYHSSGETISSFGSVTSYVGSYRIYNYNNSWSDTNDIRLTTDGGIESVSVLTDSSNWTKLSGTGSFDLTSTNLSNAGIVEGDPTYFSFSSGTPYGITTFEDPPFLPEFYTTATDEATNCICKGTKITVINEQGEEEYHNIEEMKPGMIVLTPNGNHKKVLQVMKQVLVKKRKLKNSPCKIPKDFFEKNVPFDDIYCSGNHSFLFTDEEIKKYGLEDMNFSIKNNLKSIFTFRFGMEEIFEKVCALKSDHPYQLNYYHLLIEDGEGFYTNNLSSESLDIQFKDHFEEINNDN